MSTYSATFFLELYAKAVLRNLDARGCNRFWLLPFIALMFTYLLNSLIRIELADILADFLSPAAAVGFAVLVFEHAFFPSESKEFELAPLLLRTGWRTLEVLPSEDF